MSRGRRSPVNLALPAAMTVALVAAVAVVTNEAPPPTSRRSVTVPAATGMVVDEAGRPVPRAVVTIGPTKVTADGGGRYSLQLRKASLASVSAPGHLPRTLALEPGKARNVPLTSDSARTVSLRFGGDVMMGRRYFDGADGRKPLLGPSATPARHAEILSDVEPLLKDADLTVVNLETALLADPRVEVKGKRRKDVHPDKDLVIASSTALAKGLALSGVDVVSLGNNHLYDGLNTGLTSTMRALDAAGVSHFGAGATPAQAWAPAIVAKRGQSIAFLGCTTINGRKTSMPYVAEATHGGAAECEPKRLAAEIAKVRSRVTTVVVMIHGGVEYRRRQTPDIRDLAQVAHGAGARVVVGSHPHVIGGLAASGTNVFAESMGNLAFDQPLWATFPSMLLRVDVRGGVPVAATTDPIVIDAYRPRPAIGAMADAVSRIASGTEEGGARLGPAGASLGLGPTQARPPVTVPLTKGQVRRLAPGWWYQLGVGRPATARAGTDLLFGTGDFERMEIGGSSSGAPLWSVGKYGALDSSASCGGEPGGSGLLLARTPLSTRTAFAAHDHRAAVSSGQKLSLLANLRQASEGSRLQIHWFKSMMGKSSGISSLELPPGEWAPDACRRVRFDVTVPKGVVAAQVYVFLIPPGGGQRVRRLAVDDLVLVDWAAPGRSGRRYDVLDVQKDGPVSFVADEPGTVPPGPLQPLRGG